MKKLIAPLAAVAVAFSTLEPLVPADAPLDSHSLRLSARDSTGFNRGYRAI